MGLSRLLFDWSGDGGADEPTTPHFDRLKEKVICLYEAILLFTVEQSMSESFGYYDSTRQLVFDREEALVTQLRGSPLQSCLSQLLYGVKSSRDTSQTGSGMTEEDEEGLNDLKTKLQPIEQPPYEAKAVKDDGLRLLYNWASATEEYKSFFQRQPGLLGDNGCRVLWVSGPPDVVKTMLLRATTQALLAEAEAMSSSEKFNVAYFFCDTRDQSPGYVTQVIKSLIWQMLQSQPSLAKHMKDKFRSTGRDAFNDPRDFYAMSTVLYKMLDDGDHDDGDHGGDTKFGLTYVIVDAIEELCVDDDPEATSNLDSAVHDLLRLIAKTAQVSSRIKWLVSVDHDKVAAELTPTLGTTQMRLEIDDSGYSKDLQDVAKEYISSKVAQIAKASGFGEPLKSQVTAKFWATAPRNFLWVNMACRRIESHGLPWNACSILDTLPKDVKSMYREMHAMLDQFDSTKDQDMCRDILSMTAIAYRPLRKTEVESLVNLPPYVDLDIVVNKMCSFFLELYNGKVCYVNPSARDFVRQSLIDNDEVSSKHFEMTRRCLEHVIVKGKSKSDTYAITNWIRHLCRVRGSEDVSRAIQVVNQFFDDHFLEWAEILATQDLLSEAVVLLQRLSAYLQKKVWNPNSLPAYNFLTARLFDVGQITFSPPTKQQGHYLRNIHQAQWILNIHHSIKSPGNLSPKYSLLFLPKESGLRKKLLQKALPWLEVAPEMDSGAAFGKVVHVLEGHNDWVRGCCYSPDGRLIASGGDDGVVRLWDAETANMLHTFKLGRYVYQVLFTSDNRLVAITGLTIDIWDASTGTHLKSISSPEDSPTDIHSSPDGKKLVVAKETAVVVFDVPPDPRAQGWVESTVNTEDNSGFVRSVRFSPDGALIAYTQGSKIFLRDIESGKTCRIFEGHESNIDGLAFWHNSKYLASGSDDNTIRVWETYEETETGGSLCVLDGHQNYVNCVSFSADGSRLASGSSDSTIRIWIWKGWSNGSNQKPVYEIEKVIRGHDRIILSLSFDPNEQHLLLSSGDKTARVWDIGTRQEADAGQDEAGQPPKPSHSEGHSTTISFVAFSPNGKMFASASSDGKICLWDGDKGHLLCSFTEHEVDIMSLDFSRDGSTLVSASKDRTALVWNTDLQVIKHRLLGHRDWVRCAVISPDGKLVASASDDESVRVWDLSSLPPAEAEDDGGDTKHRCFSGDKAHTDYVYAVAFSTGGRYLASGGDDLRILIWDLSVDDGDQEEPEMVFGEASDDGVRGLAFTEDEARIVSCEIGGVVRIWNVKSKACEQILNLTKMSLGFRTIQFNNHSANVLITEIGAWPVVMEAPTPLISASNSDTTAIPVEGELIRRSPPQWCPYGISNNRKWVTWNNKELIFLPAQCRPGGADRVACRVQDRKVVIGSESGQVIFFKFSESQSPNL